MPKVNHKCKRRVGGHLIGTPAASSVAFSAPPRKVSFEDGHQEPSSSECSSQSSSPCASPLLTAITEPVMPLMEPMKPLTRKSTLFRPKSSLSLVDLAKPFEEGSNHSNSLDTSGSAPVSPVPSTKRSLQTMVESGFSQSPKQPSSPWGQFVDMLIPEEDAAMPSHHYHNAPCSCCTSCRRRRASPYGFITRNKRPRSVSFIPDIDGAFVSPLSTPRFVLSQRQKEPTDHLVGALNRLRVNESTIAPIRF